MDLRVGYFYFVFKKMLTQKKLMKVAVLLILVVFLLSSGLVSVMYFVDMQKNMPEVVTGEIVTGTVDPNAGVEVLPSNILKDVNVNGTGKLGTGVTL